MELIEPGTPFPEVLAAIQDARAAWTIAARNQILGNDQLVRFDLDHIEEALERAMCALNREVLAIYGDDDEYGEVFG